MAGVARARDRNLTLPPRPGAAALPAVLLAAAVVLLYLSNLTPESLASATEASASWENELSNLRTVAATNDLIAISVAVITLGQLALESFTAGASLLIGLFFYDGRRGWYTVGGTSRTLM